MNISSLCDAVEKSPTESSKDLNVNKRDNAKLPLKKRNYFCLFDSNQNKTIKTEDGKSNSNNSLNMSQKF